MTTILRRREKGEICADIPSRISSYIPSTSFHLMILVDAVKELYKYWNMRSLQAFKKKKQDENMGWVGGGGGALHCHKL